MSPVACIISATSPDKPGALRLFIFFNAAITHPGSPRQNPESRKMVVVVVVVIVVVVVVVVVVNGTLHSRNSFFLLRFP